MTLITSSIDVTVETTTVTSENQINEATFEVNTDNEGTTIAELNISNQISELVELTHEVHSDTMNYIVETTGAVNGLSAYELWILADNVGTVEDFLDSLIGPGVPAGGTAGQILSKIDGTDYNTHWIDAPISGVSSFNSRTGDVLPAADDYAIADITGLTTALSGKEATITAGTTAQYWRGDKSWQTLDRTAVGLGNVDNTSDVNKPVSTATQTALNLKIDLSQKGAPNGVATLDSSGFIPSAQLGALAISEYLGNFADTTAALANAGVQASQRGDWFTVSSNGGESWIVTDDNPTILADITEIATPSSAVLSVNGQTGVVSLTTTHISEGSNLYFTDLRAQTALASALALKVPTSRTLTINGTGYDLSSDRSWTINTSAAGSTGEIQFNTGGSFDAKSTFIFDSSLDALGLQVALPKAAAHFAALTGVTIANVSAGSVALITESLPTSPSGATSLIAEPAAGSGGSGITFTNSGSGTAISSANGTNYWFRVYPVLYAPGYGYFRSQYYEEFGPTQDPNDSGQYDIEVNFGTVSISGETTEYFIEYSTDGGSYNPLGRTASSPYTNTGLSGSDDTTAWPSNYVNTPTTPPDPANSFDTATQQFDGSNSYYFATNQTILYEIDQYKDIGGTKYVSGTPRQYNGGSGFTDDNSNNYYYVDLTWSLNGTYDGVFLRKSLDSGSTWSYIDVGNTASYSDQNFADDGITSGRWGQTYSAGAIQHDFTPHGIGVTPSGNTIYSTPGSNYSVTIPADSVRYIVKHTMTGGSPSPWKVIAPASSPSYGIQFSGDLYDVGYTTWGYGPTVTPQSYGFTGTNQNRAYYAHAYSTSLAIYSPTSWTMTTSSSGGTKSVSGSGITYPAGTTRIRIYRLINGTGNYAYKEINSPTSTFTDDATDIGWTNVGSSYPPTPTSAIPGAMRLDRGITSFAAGFQPNLALISTGTGTRYAVLGFGVAADSATDATFQSYIYHESNTGYLSVSAGRLSVVSSLGATPSVILAGASTFNNLNSNSGHFIIKGQTDSYLFNTRADYDTVGFGQQLSGDPQATVHIQPARSSDFGIYLRGHSSMTNTTQIFMTSSSAGSFGGAITVGGHFQAAQGNASAPGHNFRADGDTGMFNPTTNELAFSTGGTERMRIKIVGSSPSVGIGTTSPTAKLHLAAGSTAVSSAPLKFTSGALTTGVEIGAVEFLTDNLYYTKTTGPARVVIVAALALPTNGRVAYAGAGGFMQDTANFTYSVNRLSPTYLTLAAGTATAGTAPLVMTSGTLLSSPIAGAVEFLTDKWYATITTGPARKELTLNDIALTPGRVPFVTTNGRLTDDADFTFATDTLTVTKIAATTFTGNITMSTKDIVTDTTTGTKIATSASQKIGFWNATPIIQPTTAILAATFVTNTSGIVDDTATFDGYTIGQIVKGLRNVGLLA